MKKIGQNKVFIATSLDGYIADKSGRVDFLDNYHSPEDTGYNAFMDSVDAILMGRNTYETVLGFGIDWPYSKPVFVWSSTIETIPENLAAKVRVVKGDLLSVLKLIHIEGHLNLYIDGGKVIQSFLKEDLIDEMTITVVPMLLGSGIPLFAEQTSSLKFSCMNSKRFQNGLVQNVYTRIGEQ